MPLHYLGKHEPKIATFTETLFFALLTNTQNSFKHIQIIT